MEKLLGDNWQTEYPVALTAEDKARLKDALLENLSRGKSGYYDLCNFLQGLKVIEVYPLKTPQGE